MKTIETLILHRYEGLLYLLVAAYLYKELLPIFKRIRSYTTSWIQSNSEKRKKSLVKSLNYVSDKNPVLKDMVKHEIENIIYSDLTGYNWSRQKHLQFLNFYNKIKDRISLKDFKFLFGNCHISKDGVVSIKTTFSTKVYVIQNYVLLVLSGLMFLCLFVLSFLIYKEPFGIQFFIAILCVISLFGSFFLFGEIIRIKRLIKFIKGNYDNYLIPDYETK
ncbi:hypothetical protein ED312_08820 [Sinomicrobium pectinilyticum]|uniref:Uncharacterized protein n=1 Tax=Sinomicrobium pectinilyticum TaxID=1084421 RepID=A0A3N0ELJ2_SINP1|nr:hypothetical protein [Sinomicrobium pectinilyticum]RNL88539.1 hypothetical protein ED312_08820 [Sinomicrobium pectinilyticum]